MWKEELIAFAKKFEHPAWGVSHDERLYELSLQLARADDVGVDEDALFAASYLHDMGTFDPYRQEGVDHAERSAQICGEILEPMGFPPDKSSLVKDIILGHMFYVEPPSAIEAVIFHDADVLDFMGAIGITRLLSTVGRAGWTPDLPSALKLIQRFSGELPDRLHTNEARKIGKVRQQEMMAYLNALSSETKGFSLL